MTDPVPVEVADEPPEELLSSAEGDTSFEEDEVPPRYIVEGRPGDLTLDLGTYEGPLDILLTLARTQKVDLAQISILALAEQYLAFIAEVRKTHLEIAADYLVMAAWLAYLKSKLLIPEEESDEDGPTGEELAARLAFRLQRLEAMRESAAKIFSRSRLGREVFQRGDPEGITVIRKSKFVLEVYDLLKAYSDQKVRSESSVLYIPRPKTFSIDDSLRRLRRMVGDVPAWSQLLAFLPESLGPDAKPIDIKSAVASTFAASLEIAKQGEVQLRQEETFAPIYIRRKPSDEGDVSDER